MEKILNENEDIKNRSPYEKETDESIPNANESRKKLLKLKDLNRLKKIRNKKREEIAQDSVFVPILYGPQEQPDDGMGGLQL